MIDFRHFIYTLLGLVAALCLVSLTNVYTREAVWVLVFVVAVWGLFFWADRKEQRLRRRFKK